MCENDKDTRLEKKTTLSKKMIVTMVPVVIVFFAIVVLYSYFKFSDIIKENKLQALRENSKKNVAKIEGWQDQVLSMVDSVANTIEKVNFKDHDEMQKFFLTTQPLNKSVPNGLYGGDKKNDYYDGANWVPDKDYVVKERDWYKDAQNFGYKAGFGEAYVDAQTGDVTISASRKVKNKKFDNFVLSADVYLDTISSEIKEIEVLEDDSAYAMLISPSNATVLAHKDSKYDGYILNKDDKDEFMAEVAKNCDVKEYKYVEQKQEKEKCIVTYDYIHSTGWVLVTATKESEIFSSLYKIRNIYIIAGIIIALILVGALWFMVSKAMKPVEELTNNIGMLSDGYLDIQINTSGNDELAQMKKALFGYVNRMRDVMKGIVNISSDLKGESENTNIVSNDMLSSVQAQADSMENVEKIVESLQNGVSAIKDNANTLTEVVNITNTDATKASDFMDETIEIAKRDYDNMSKLKLTMNSIKDDTNTLFTLVEKVGGAMQEINNMVNIIRDIADSTNLLSLNASIEAARAGELGKGFAVVADEIGSLAENSSNSTKEIASIIDNVNELVECMIDRTRKNVELIDSNVGSVENAYNDFADIFDNIEKANEKTKNLVDEINNVNNVAADMVSLSNEQSESTNKIFESVEEVATTAQKLVEVGNIVKESSLKLSDTADTLNENISIFKI